MTSQRYRGRKRIWRWTQRADPADQPQPDGVLVKALARASRWQKLLDRGVYTSVTEIDGAEKISKSYVSRILWLALCAGYRRCDPRWVGESGMMLVRAETAAGLG